MGRIPERFRPDAQVEWSPAWSLRDDAERWLPTRYCYFDYRAPDVPDDHAFCTADSNGCASGGSLEEAILQAFLEVVERDAISIWWYNRLARREIDPAGLNDAFTDRMRAHYAAKGQQFHLLDLTTDLGIPVVVAVSSTIDGRRILLGFGAHLDGRIAALRALTELNQLAGLDGQDRPRDNRFIDETLWGWLDRETLSGHPYLVPQDGPAIIASDLASPGFSSVGHAVRHCVDVASAAGHEIGRAHV